MPKKSCSQNVYNENPKKVYNEKVEMEPKGEQHSSMYIYALIGSLYALHKLLYIQFLEKPTDPLWIEIPFRTMATNRRTKNPFN